MVVARVRDEEVTYIFWGGNFSSIGAEMGFKKHWLRCVAARTHTAKRYLIAFLRLFNCMWMGGVRLAVCSIFFSFFCIKSRR